METKIDPRVARTRKAIIDAFIQLSESKPFDNITVKDITEKALINRATFYNHFLDKYDLMEKSLLEDVQINLNRQYYSEMGLDDAYVISLFEALCSFHLHLAAQCQRSYIQTINHLVVDQLEVIHSQKLKQAFDEYSDAEIHKMSKLFASGLFSLSQDWFASETTEEPVDYIHDILPMFHPFLGQ